MFDEEPFCEESRAAVTITLSEEDDDIVQYIKKEAELSFINMSDVVKGILREHIKDLNNDTS